MASDIISVHKFGGACFKSPFGFTSVLKILKDLDGPSIIVPSAFYGVTETLHSFLKNTNVSQVSNQISKLRSLHLQIFGRVMFQDEKKKIDDMFSDLEKLARGIVLTGEVSSKIRDHILSFGERLASLFLMFALKDLSPSLLDPTNVLRTNGVHYEAAILLDESEDLVNKNLLPLLENSNLVIIPGYYGGDKNGNVTLLGRSGTDYSAAAIASLVDASSLTIWKEVPAFMTADPNLIPDAKPLPFLDYDTSEVLTQFGAKLIHPKALEPLKKKDIPLYIRNFNEPSNHTLIGSGGDKSRKYPVLSVRRNLVVISLYFNDHRMALSTLNRIKKDLHDEGISLYGAVVIGGKILLALEKKHLSGFHNFLSSLPLLHYEEMSKDAIFILGGGTDAFMNEAWFKDIIFIPATKVGGFLLYVDPERTIAMARTIHRYLLDSSN